MLSLLVQVLIGLGIGVSGFGFGLIYAIKNCKNCSNCPYSDNTEQPNLSSSEETEGMEMIDNCEGTFEGNSNRH